MGTLCFGVNIIVKSSNKIIWEFDNHFPRNIVIFGPDNSSSSHHGNLKNNY